MVRWCALHAPELELCEKQSHVGNTPHTRHAERSLGGGLVIGELDLSSLGVLAGIGIGIVVVGTPIVAFMRHMLKNHKTEEHQQGLIRVAIFGRPADPPLLPITGLLADNQTNIAKLAKLARCMDSVVKTQREMRQDIKELLDRTQANGGNSLVDQLSRIEAQTGAAGQSQGSLDRIEEQTSPDAVGPPDLGGR